MAESSEEEVQIIPREPFKSTKGKTSHSGQIKSSKKTKGQDVPTLIGDLAMAISSDGKTEMYPEGQTQMR